MNVVSKHVAEMIDEFLKNDICRQIACHSFKGQSYSRSAAKEILELISVTDIPPLVILENYRDTMFKFANLNSLTCEMFRVGGETAEYFIAQLT